jgi:O-antigen/teichoic acid export membrane protein
VAVFCIPLLIRGLGADRFGVLTLVWALIGYASLFDLGLGRALTQLVAKKLGAGDEREIPALAWTSLLLMLLLGLVGAAVVGLTSPWLVHRVLHIPSALQVETLRSFYLLGLSIPVVINTAGLRGLLEAYQRFGLINALRIPMGMFTFAGPLLILPFSRSLFPVVGLLVSVRLIAWGAHLLLCLRVVPAFRQHVAWQRSAIAALLRFGGWMTVSNIIAPMMLNVERFVIGALISTTAVAYYAIPYEVVTKLLIVSASIATVMFPAFSLFAAQTLGQSSILYQRAMRCTLTVFLPSTLLLMLAAKAGLALWLGHDFAINSYRVAQLLILGTFALGMEALPFALIQGLGRPDIPAKLNLIEIPLYAAALYWLIQRHGVEGAALAWASRAIIDAILLIYIAYRLLEKPSTRPAEALASALQL